MTEREFDRSVEEMAARFDRRVEASADKLDKGVTRKYNESRWFRFATRGIFTAVEIGLLIGAKNLYERGHETAAMWCAGPGVVGLAAELVRILVFGREK